MQCRLNANILSGFVKLIGYIASAVNVVSSDLVFGYDILFHDISHKTSTCTDDFLTAPKIITFLLMLQSVYEHFERQSNPML